ncbi:MAG: hypothetical protein RSE62_03650 [Citrobacter sp.]
MLLVDPSKVSQAISMSPSGGAGNTDLNILKAVIESVRTRVEATMNVSTLKRVNCVDIFDVKSDGAEVAFRLSNGFIKRDSVSVVGSDGSILIDHRLGIVRVANCATGRYTISYASGFEVDTGDIAIDVPDDIQGFIIPAVTLWLRTTVLTLKLPTMQGLSLEHLTAPLLRDIAARIYGSYDRPRATVEWPLLYEEV